MGSIYEPRSVMSYGSYATSTTSGVPVALLKDGGQIFDGERITTEDALQVQWMYCKEQPSKFPGFEYTETATCTSQDEVGATRKVFTSRLCDGISDCPNGEDEGDLAVCKEIAPRTPNGCCGAVVRGGQTCTHNPDYSYGDRETFACEDGTGVMFVPWASNRWLHVVAATYPIEGSVSWMSSIADTGICPPTTWAACAVDGYDATDNCETNDCDPNATCTSGFESYTCECNENYTGDGNTCTFIPEVNECADGSHQCDENASCSDLRDGYTCSCNAGWKDSGLQTINGRDCVEEAACCDAVQYDLSFII